MSLAFFCPAEVLPEANKIVALVGANYGVHNFSKRLSENGKEPVTYYGGYLAGKASPAFLGIIDNARKGIIPDGLEQALGFDPLVVFKKFKVELDISFNAALEKHNLQVIEESE